MLVVGNVGGITCTAKSSSVQSALKNTHTLILALNILPLLQTKTQFTYPEKSEATIAAELSVTQKQSLGFFLHSGQLSF